MASSWQHIPVHSESEDHSIENPFDENLQLTFPPPRYMPLFYDQASTINSPQPKAIRRQSSRDRERLYRELVGHEPYRPIIKKQITIDGSSEGNFRIKLDVKHYKPDEITLKVDG